MRFLQQIYILLDKNGSGRVPKKKEFGGILKKVKLRDVDFNTITFPPGTSGEAKMLALLREALRE